MSNLINSFNPQEGYKFWLADLNNADELLRKNRDAVTICGFHLRECLICAEMIRDLMYDARELFKNAPFFKGKNKQLFNRALDKVISHAGMFYAQSDVNLIKEFTDRIKFLLYEDKNKLLLSLQLAYQRGKVPYPKEFALIELIRLLSDISDAHYDNTIEMMKEFYSDANYDKAYSQTRMDDFNFWYEQFRLNAINMCVPEDRNVDPNTDANIRNGVKIIVDKLMDRKFQGEQMDIAIEETNGNPHTEEALEVYRTFGFNI